MIHDTTLSKALPAIVCPLEESLTDNFACKEASVRQRRKNLLSLQRWPLFKQRGTFLQGEKCV